MSDHSFNLIFPVERVADVLMAVGAMSTGESTHSTVVTLPDGRSVSMPFASWAGDDQAVLLTAGSKVRLDAFLRFPGGVDAESGDEAVAIPYVRIWVFMGERYAELSFFAGNSRMGERFVTSPSIHTAMARLLESHEGVVGLLDIGVKELYLLPDLRRYVVAPTVLAYYDSQHRFDVDRWTADLLAVKVREAERPVHWMRGQAASAQESKAIKVAASAPDSFRGLVPKRYHRTFEEKPFDTCDFCKRSLLVPGVQYVVSKVYALGELQHETAMCDGCRAELTANDSEESRQTMARIFEAVRHSERLAMAAADGPDRVDRMTARCILCDSPRLDSDWHIEHARCESTEIVYDMHPFLVCHTCTVRIHDELSEQTRGERWRFYERHFGFPPPGKPTAEVESGRGIESLFTGG